MKYYSFVMKYPIIGEYGYNVNQLQILSLSTIKKHFFNLQFYISDNCSMKIKTNIFKHKNPSLFSCKIH